MKPNEARRKSCLLESHRGPHTPTLTPLSVRTTTADTIAVLPPRARKITTYPGLQKQLSSTTRPEREQVFTSTFCWLSTLWWAEVMRSARAGDYTVVSAYADQRPRANFAERKTRGPALCNWMCSRWAPRVILRYSNPRPSTGKVVQIRCENNRCGYAIGYMAPALHKIRKTAWADMAGAEWWRSCKRSPPHRK